MAATFISYRREDSAGYAGRLHEELEQRLGSGQVFRDVDSLHAGQDFVATIDERLQQCSALVALIGKQWLNARTASGARRLDQPDDYVALEIGAALQRPAVLVVPVLVGGASMPPSADLPGPIRPLARRHALTLRDETWESDVDRLAALVSKPVRRRPAFPMGRRPGIAAAAAIALLAGLLVVFRGGSTPAGEGDSTGGSTPSVLPASRPSTAWAIDVPARSEVAHGELIYTLISGSVAPRGNANGVRLRFRVSNEGRYDANLWDSSFRLAVGDELLQPTSGLNELAAGRSIRHAIVTFNVPANASRGVLHILGGDDVAELPLDLAPSGRAPDDEKADDGDALSRARLAWVVRNPQPLVATDGMSATLDRVTSRLFVNKVRIRAVVRLTNEGRYPMHSGVLTLRMAHDGDVAGPVAQPNEAIAPGTSHSGDYIFEVPPSTKAFELRAMAGNESVSVPLEVR